MTVAGARDVRSRVGTPPWRDGALLALGALVIRLPAFFASRHLLFDDGTYGVSAVEMRHGAMPFRDLFSPQGPLHLVLVYVADVVGLHTLNGPRVLPVAAGVVATLAAWSAGRRLGGRVGGLVAGALVATSGSLLWTTGPITGDGPATALALVAVAVAFAYRDEPTTTRAALAGLALSAALTTKVIVLPAAIVVAWCLYSKRRWRDLAIAVGVAITFGLAITAPFGFDRVWEQSVEYHQESERLESVGEQANKLLTTLLSRDLTVIVAAVLGLIAARRALARRGRAHVDTLLLGMWFVVGVVLLVIEPTMFRNHIATLVPPLALLAALHPPPWRVFAALLLFLVPWWAVQCSDVLWPHGYTGDEKAVVAALHDLPDGAQAISDEPGLLWRAGRRTPPWLNDGSVKRIQQGNVTTDVVAKEAARDNVCAAVVWSFRWGSELPGLPDALRDLGYAPVTRYSGPRTLWIKQPCRP